MLDDFIMNDSYDAFTDEYEEYLLWQKGLLEGCNDDVEVN